VGGHRNKDFSKWLNLCKEETAKLLKTDASLSEFIQNKEAEIAEIINDYEILMQKMLTLQFNLDQNFPLTILREFASLSELSFKSKAVLNKSNFFNALKRSWDEKKPFSFQKVFNRITSLDWTLLDLFYRLCGFKDLKGMFDLAEKGEDEGPICNLSLLSNYFSKFMNEFKIQIFTAQILREKVFSKLFFHNYLYTLFRLQESEYEDEENPFPKGRIPFLTIHQSKGLEFPVVVLANLYRKEREASIVEKTIRKITGKNGEPLEKISLFDNMRMFYVALSRSKNVLILPRYKGQGQKVSESFKFLMENNPFELIANCEVSKLDEAKNDQNELGKNYSYTSDYLMYEKCPRNYMIFKNYGFDPSRTQTMLFGSLVHETIEDLHHALIDNRRKEQ
jgi:DNA helicase-2/ATP-dependent DNA helicase PcrA